MGWFKKKSEEVKPKVIKLEKLYLKKDLDSIRIGMTDLATEYFMQSLPEEKYRLADLLFSINQKDYAGISILDVMFELNEEELLKLQKLIEKDYKIIKQ